MVVVGCADPRAEEGLEWFEDVCADTRMGFEDLPFFLVRTPLFLQDFGGDGKLSDVVEDEPPAESVEVFVVEAHFGADHFAIGTNPLDMSASQTVVFVEGGDQGDGFAGGFAFVFGQGWDGGLEFFCCAGA